MKNHLQCHTRGWPGQYKLEPGLYESFQNLKESAGYLDEDEYLKSDSRHKEKSGSGTKKRRTFLYAAILGLILLVSGSVYIFQRMTIEIRWNPRGTPKSAAAPSIVQVPISLPQKPEDPRKDSIPEKPAPPVPQTFPASARQEKPPPAVPEPSKAASPKPAPSLSKGILELIKQEAAEYSIRRSAKEVSGGTAGGPNPSRVLETAPSQQSAVAP